MIRSFENKQQRIAINGGRDRGVIVDQGLMEPSRCMEVNKIILSLILTLVSLVTSVEIFITECSFFVDVSLSADLRRFRTRFFRILPS